MTKEGSLEGYKTLNMIIRTLNAQVPEAACQKRLEEARKGQISRCLETAALFQSMHSELAAALTNIVEQVPEESFEVYTRLIKKAFAENSFTNYRANAFYRDLAGLIDKYNGMAGFLKSVLRAVDKEICTSIENPLPPDHPYLNNKGD